MLYLGAIHLRVLALSRFVPLRLGAFAPSCYLAFVTTLCALSHPLCLFLNIFLSVAILNAPALRQSMYVFTGR